MRADTAQSARTARRFVPTLCEQFLDRFAFAVAGDVEGALLDFVRKARRDAEGVENGGVEVFDDDAILDCLARAFVGSFAVEKSFLDAAPEQEHGSCIR